MLETIFWLLVLLVLYPYLIYPFLIWLWTRFQKIPVLRKQLTPHPYVTIVIAAYNEAESIKKTIENKLSLQYPQDRLEIIVISDGSTDDTDQIIKSFKAKGIRYLRQEPNQGKAAALNFGIKEAVGDIIVFSDANSLFREDMIDQIVRNFAEPTVGYVTGKLGFIQEDRTVVGDGCSAYMRYENQIRKLETSFCSVIGVNGGVDAIRKSLYVEIPPKLITDFILPLKVIEQGYRVVYDENVRSFEIPNNDIGSEYKMRVRVATRGLQGLKYMKNLLNFAKYPRPAFSLISHKLIRYCSPLFLVGILLLNILLYNDSFFYAILLWCQVIGYGIGILGNFNPKLASNNSWVGLLSYFCMTNVAFLGALYRYLKGEHISTWKPRSG